METFEIDVYGKVQGVGYRWFVKKTATDLGISGWVKNNYDGSVKIVAQGDPLQIDTFTDFLRIGPPMARVSGISSAKIHWTEPFNEFQIK